MLKLRLTDGRQTVGAIEYRRVPHLNDEPAHGTKLLVANVAVLGTACCGKTTILKQLSINYLNGIHGMLRGGKAGALYEHMLWLSDESLLAALGSYGFLAIVAAACEHLRGAQRPHQPLLAPTMRRLRALGG